MEARGRVASFILGRIWQNILALSALGCLFFVFSGSIAIPGFWIYCITALGYQLISLFILVPGYPAYMELDKVRRERHAGVKPWDRRVLLLASISMMLMYVLGALDAGRWHLLALPAICVPAGIVLYAAGSALNQWAMLHNRHFEAGVRIQADRGHQVMTGGPYRYVRHPGYLGSILGLLSFPLVIGSGLALAGSVLGIAIMLVRTDREDRTLLQELDGYVGYAEAVRYRLFPPVW